MTMMTKLCMEGLTLRTSGLTRVDDVSAEVLPASLVAIVGANGSGKSSLLDLMAGVTKPTSGQISLNGQPLRSISPDRLALQRAWLSQTTLGGEAYLVREVIAWGRGRAKDDELTRASVDALAGTLGLTELLTVPLGRLSGGERQRANLARIWLQDAPLTLLDEPDASLDSEGRKLLHQLIGQKRDRGHAIVIVTHDHEWARASADHIWVMNHGARTEQ
ncbi:MAG: ABC transporter ATP-binding protein [Actinomycetota bacterium]|nr:ABC transporter ATP-binding protein [Actinomycetota bacterium]